MSDQLTTKRPSANAVTVGPKWREGVLSTRSSTLDLDPSLLKTCARIALATPGCPLVLMSSQAATKRPSGSPAIEGPNWSEAVDTESIRNSATVFDPPALNACPRTAERWLSPPLSLMSLQAATKRPSASAVIVG